MSISANFIKLNLNLQRSDIVLKSKILNKLLGELALGDFAFDDAGLYNKHNSLIIILAQTN